MAARDTLAHWTRRLDDLMRLIETAVVSFCLGISALMAFALIAGRNLLDRSYNALEEISVYLLIWMVFAGMAVADRARQHISIDLVYHLIPRFWQDALQRTADALQGLVSMALAWYCLDAVLFSWRIGERSVSSLEQPIWVLMVIMPVTFLVVGIRSFARVFFLDGRDARQPGVPPV